MKTAMMIFAAGFLAASVADAAGPAPNAALNARAVAFAPAKPTLLLRGLDKITGRAFDIVAPLNTPVKFATLTVTARYCYSTPPSETPETAAFVQIDGQSPRQAEARSVLRAGCMPRALASTACSTRSTTFG